MWKALLLLLVGTACASSGAWKPLQQYVYNVQARSLTALHQVADQYTGILINANLTIEKNAQDQNVLLGMLHDPMYAEVNQHLPQGLEEEIPTHHLHWQKLPMESQPFELQLKNGLIQQLRVMPSVKEWEANLLKGLLSPLQVNVLGQNTTTDKHNALPQQHLNSSVFTTMESTVTGECEVLYDIAPLPALVALQNPELAPLVNVTKANLMNIVKTQDFTNCKRRVGLNFFFSGFNHFEPGQNQMGTFISRSSLTQTVIDGSINNFTIQSSVTTDKVIVSPEMYNKEKGIVASRVNLTIVSIRHLEDQVQSKSNLLQSVGDLVYNYNHPLCFEHTRHPFEDNKSHSSSQENSESSSHSSHEHHQHSIEVDKKIQKSINKKHNNREQVLTIEKDFHTHWNPERQRRSVDPLHTSSSSSESSDSHNQKKRSQPNDIHERTLPRPSREQAPQIPMLPLFIANDGKAINSSVEPVQAAKNLSMQIALELQDVNSIAQDHTLAKFEILVDLIRTMHLTQLRVLIDTTVVSEDDARSTNTQKLAWRVVRDAIAQSGTHPALVVISELIEKETVIDEIAAQILSILSNAALLPTNEYMEDFFKLVTSEHTKAHPNLKNSALISYTNLLRKVAVDHETAHNNYPVHVFGNMLNDHKQVREQAIQYLAKEMNKAIHQHDNTSIQAYIRALGNIAHPSILPHYKPYLEGVKNVSRFQRLLMVASLDRMTNVHPEVAQEVLFKLYENFGEDHEVRCASVFLLMLTKPSAVLMQRMAQMTNSDPNQHVIAAVQSALREAAALKGPANILFARNAQAAVHLLNPKKFDSTYSRSIMKSYRVKDMELEMQHSLNYIGSTDSSIPNSVFAHTDTIMGGGKKEHVNFAAMLSSVKELIKLLQDQLQILQADSSQNHEQDSASNHNNEWENLKLVHDLAQQVEGNVDLHFVGAERFFPFDRHTIQKLIRDLIMWVQNPKPKAVLSYTKLSDSQSMTVAFPNALGLPTVISLKNPVLLNISLDASVQLAHIRHNNPSEHVLVPNSVNMSANIQAMFSTWKQSKIGFVTPFNSMRYIAGINRNALINIPVQLAVDLDIHNQHMSASLKPLNSTRDFRILQWNTVPYIAKHYVNSLQPAIQTNASILHVHPAQNVNQNVGLQSTGMVFHTNVSSENRLVNLKSQGVLANALALLLNDAINYHNINIDFNAQESTAKIVNITLAHSVSRKQEQYEFPVYEHNESQESQEVRRKHKSSRKSRHRHPRSLTQYDSIEEENTEMNQQQNLNPAVPHDESLDSSDRRQEYLVKSAKAVANSTASVLDVSVLFVGSEARYAITVAHAKSQVNPSFSVLAYIRADPAQKSQNSTEFRAYLSLNSSVPQATFLDLQAALNSNLNSTIKAQLNFGNKNANSAAVHLKALLGRSNMHKENILRDPITALCQAQMQSGNNILPACQHALLQATALDHIQAVVNYEGVSEAVINKVYHAYSIARHFAFPTVQENILPMKTQPNQLQMELQLNYDINTLNALLQTPQMNVTFVNTPLKHASALLPLNLAPQQKIKALAKSTCLVDQTAVNTFDNKTYPLHLINTNWHTIMMYVPKIRHAQQASEPQMLHNALNKLSVDISNTDENNRKVMIRLGNDVLTLLPAEHQQNPQVQENGKLIQEISQEHITMLYRNNQPYVVIHLLPNKLLHLSFFNNMLSLVYDSKRVMLQASNSYRDEVRGLCGTMDGEQITDFKTPRNLIVQDPRIFAHSYLVLRAPFAQEFEEVQQLVNQAPSVLHQNQHIEVIFNTTLKNHHRLLSILPSEASSSESSSSSSSSSSDTASFDSRSSSSSSSSSESDEKRLTIETLLPPKPTANSASCTAHHTKVIVQRDEICFSIRPLPECTQQCHATDKTRKNIKFHCLPKGPTAEHWQNMVKKGVNPDLTKKTVHKELSINISLKCKLN